MRNTSMYFGSKRSKLAGLNQSHEPRADGSINNQTFMIGSDGTHRRGYEPLSTELRIDSGLLAREIDMAGVPTQHGYDTPAMPLTKAHFGGFFVPGIGLAVPYLQKAAENTREGVRA